ncbi:lysozyme inhibitor LprI family protein [Undibacterium sp. TJN25]|uniref:lysozyme inhibitor LprI family protein n=1 Tax=Undibacterium sp. TJN25 TaxID=3413056 RepID=UPI003BF22516
MPARFVVGLVFSFVLTAASAKDAVCYDPKDDIEDRQCMSAEVDKADEKLAKYIEAAKARIAEDQTIELSLDVAQKAWLSYRSAQCGDVYTYWLRGTYRYRVSLQCMIDLTQERTHDIWSAYLTYVDSTPATLPEP